MKSITFIKIVIAFAVFLVSITALSAEDDPIDKNLTPLLIDLRTGERRLLGRQSIHMSNVKAEITEKTDIKSILQEKAINTDSQTLGAIYLLNSKELESRLLQELSILKEKSEKISSWDTTAFSTTEVSREISQFLNDAVYHFNQVVYAIKTEAYYVDADILNTVERAAKELIDIFNRSESKGILDVADLHRIEELTEKIKSIGILLKTRFVSANQAIPPALIKVNTVNNEQEDISGLRIFYQPRKDWEFKNRHNVAPDLSTPVFLELPVARYVFRLDDTTIRKSQACLKLKLLGERILPVG